MSQSQIQQKKANILIVDDKQENLHLLAHTLTIEGYQVRGVVNGTMALRVAKSVQPDLILLDIMMPDLDGYEVCQKLKEDEDTKNIPIIFLSADNEVFGKVKAFAVGGVDYISKPFQIDEVLARIKHQLDLQTAEAEIRRLNFELEQRIQERTGQLKAANQELEQEIKERREIAKLLQESEERLESILNSLEEVVWSADIQTRKLIFINPAAEKVYGTSTAELFHNPYPRLEFIHPEDQQQVKQSLENLYQYNNINLEYRIIRPNGEIRWLWERTRIIYNLKGQAIRLDGIIHDITERKIIEEKLSYEALHDALTGLPNRTLFLERIEKALKQSQQQQDYLFAILFIDLDRFKIVNDSLGHGVGDQLLIIVAQLIQKCLRSTDMAARLGGDEFTIFLDNINSVEDTKKVAERIKSQLTRPISLENYTIFTGASIGIAIANYQYQQASEILRDADIAMYRAKSQGKACYKVFDQTMYAQTLELLKLENDLRKAIEHQEFLLHYQPIICLITGKLYGFEALVRWQHPKRGLVPPSKFIDIAEDTGLIIPLGEWILKQACRQFSTWQSEFPSATSLKMSVNLASPQIREPNFLSNLEQILRENKLDSSCLNLEITETMLIDYGETTINLFQQIRTRKIQLSIDDFGTGYSSLSYLHRFPINKLKIDRSFVSGMTAEKENLEIVRTIITLARTLNIGVIAEGIETVEQLKQLRNFGCQLGQGYLFSQPLDFPSATLLLEKNPQWFQIKQCSNGSKIN
jgi:diguanylate cyclase (GGDEF)-like protein/PAS domain S-box-containing protein